jgi:membrane carboxypeptidase/penicillin-binding protein
MNLLLVKIMAVGITVSQLFSNPDQFKAQFDPEADQAQVAQHLKAGCAFMMGKFNAEDVDFDLLFNTAISESKKAQAQPSTAPGTTISQKLTKDLDFELLFKTYKIYCKNENISAPEINLAEVIKFYNEALKDLPDISHMKTFRLEESAVVLDRNGERFSEIYSKNNRRTFVPIAQIPEHVKKAFVAAEDKNFYSPQHNGLDVIGIIRAFSSTMSGEGRPQGGSTITQQVVKNLILNDDLTFERKMREMVLAVRLEKVLTKDQILELYLNFVYLGRASWGVEMAAKSYFGKSIRDVSPAEAALIAALAKGPNYYNPEQQPDRARGRRHYVLGRMKEDKALSDADYASADSSPLGVKPFETPHSRGAFYFLDAIQREAKEKGLLGKPYVVKSTIHPEMQKITDQALRDGLVEYEGASGRAKWTGTQGSIADDIKKYQTKWQDLLPRLKGKLYDVPWTLAVVLDPRNSRVGLADGRVVQVRGGANIIRTLAVYDLVFVVLQDVGNNQVVASLRTTPQVQGSVVVIENRTGSVLAMSGGFSYAGSPYNRALDAVRQPGSTLKPFIYLAALNLELQPNTLIPDAPVYLPPIERGGKPWSPKNYDGGSRGLVTIRRAIEQSLNLPTARIMSELGRTPTEGLDYVRGVIQEVGIYEKAERYYPTVLGSQPTRLIDMAQAYATVANDGLRPTIHFIESIEDAGKPVYKPNLDLRPLPSVDRVSFYQLRRILMGTVARGTAVKLKDLYGSIAGKTGTSNNENDAWFMVFTNDLTIGVWVGYDDRNVRSNLGARFTGGRVALPIAEKILRASFQSYKPQELMAGPSPDVAPKVAEYNINVTSGQFGGGDFKEVFRRDQSGTRIIDSTRRILKNHENALGYGEGRGEEENPYQMPQLADQDQWRGQYGRRYQGGYYQPGYEDPYAQRRQQQRVDPNYRPFFPFFGGRQ